MSRRAAGLVAALCLAAPLRAQTPPEPGARYTISLVTIGPGRAIWERFGHNAIWVHDSLTGSDTTYNYGMFDFRQEHFVLHFIQGRMEYWMEGHPAQWEIASYVQANRSVWVQRLDLAPAERLALVDFLRWNALPANRFYRYDYYRDNCSTRVRDALDRVLGGQLRAALEDVPAGRTYRFDTRRLTTNNLLYYTGLKTALGSPVDRPISRWDEMYLPLALHKYVGTLTVRGADGAPHPLVLHEDTLYLSSAPLPPSAPPDWWPRYLALGVVVGALLWWWLGAAPRHAAARWLGGLGATAWSVLAGTGGVVMLGLWLFTDHVVTRHNENLFVANPASLLLAVLIPLALYRPDRWGRRAGGLAWIVAAAALAGLAWKALPGPHQVNGEILALAIPLHLGIAAGLARGARRPAA